LEYEIVYKVDMKVGVIPHIYLLTNR